MPSKPEHGSLVVEQCLHIDGQVASTSCKEVGNSFATLGRIHRMDRNIVSAAPEMTKVTTIKNKLLRNKGKMDNSDKKSRESLVLSTCLSSDEETSMNNSKQAKEPIEEQNSFFSRTTNELSEHSSLIQIQDQMFDPSPKEKKDSSTTANILPFDEALTPSKKKTECSATENCLPLENMTTKRKKPHRPRPYCHKKMSKLRKHLETKHSDEDAVKIALELPKQERDASFDAIRKKGIFKMNVRILQDKTKSSKDLLREREQKSNTDIVYCSKCLAFISTRLFYRHKKTCYMTGNSTKAPSKRLPSHTLNTKDESEFRQSILGSFHGDEVGHICRSDVLIADFGRREFKKVTIQKDKRDEKRKSLQGEMRRLGRLYLAFRKTCKTENVKCDTAIEMFDRANFSTLESSINCMSSQDSDRPRDGMKLRIGYLLKKVAKYIYGRYLENKEDEKAEEINKFISLLNYQWLHVFGEAEYSVKKVRQSSLRKPQSLPVIYDVQRLRDFTVGKINNIVNDKYNFIGNTDFTLLRDLTVCRLTLFNARRGGEPSRLTLKEWDEAEKSIWTDNSNRTITDPLEKKLLGRYKLAYQPGKTGKLVPLLVINDCWEAIRILTDIEIRTRIGISKDNMYVFPYSQMSNRHVLGWNAVNKCCKLAGCSKMINATNRRHHVATMYAAHEVPSEERAGFLLHMDHSEGINVNVYQSPPALREITKVGKILYELDKTGTIDNNYPSTSSDLGHINKTSCTRTQCSDEDEKTHEEDSCTTTRKRKSELQLPEKHKDIGKRKRLEQAFPRGKSGAYESDDQVVFREESPFSRVSGITDCEDSGDEYRPPKSPTFSSDESSDQNTEYEPTTPKGMKDIRIFLEKHPDVLAGQRTDVQIQRVKTKIFNERKTIRGKMVPSGK